MKKSNRKGFVLAEAIVVGVFLIELLSILIINVLPLIGQYERSFKYDQIDRKYDINLIRKMILMAPNNNNILSNYDISYSSSKGYIVYNNMNDFCSEINYSYCYSLLTDSNGNAMLNVKSLILTKYNTTNLKQNVNTLSISRGFKEYIKYLPSDALIVTNDIAYRPYKKLIVEFSNNTYASIEVPYE